MHEHILAGFAAVLFVGWLFLDTDTPEEPDDEQ